MIITVHLHTIYQLASPNGPVRLLEMDLPEGSPLAALLSRIPLEPDPETTLLVVNGRLAEMETILCEGDEVHIIPALSGGIS